LPRIEYFSGDGGGGGVCMLKNKNVKVS